MTRAIVHNEDQQRFEWTKDGALALVEYKLKGDVMTIVHTEVPEALGGRGIAGDLVRHALETARAQSWSVKTKCSYTEAYIKRHPEYWDLLD